MLLMKILFSLHYHFRHMVFPFPECKCIAKIRLIANLIIKIIKVLQLMDNLPDHILLHIQQFSMLKRQYFLMVLKISYPVDIINYIQRRQFPLNCIIIIGEKVEFNNNISFPGFCHKILQS